MKSLTKILAFALLAFTALGVHAESMTVRF